MEPVERWQKYETRDGVLALHVVWLLRFNWVMRAPRPEVTWKPLLSKNKDMKESGIHVPESYFSKIFFQPWSVSCTALQNLGHRQ